MKRYLQLAIYCLLAVCLSSCTKEDPLLKAAKEAALKQEVYGVFKTDKTVFAYKAASHQLAYNPTQRMMRIQTDDLSRVLQLTLDQTPVQGKTCKLTLKSAGLTGLATSYNVEVVQVSEKDKMLRLVDPESLYIFVMYYDFD